MNDTLEDVFHNVSKALDFVNYFDIATEVVWTLPISMVEPRAPRYYDEIVDVASKHRLRVSQSPVCQHLWRITRQ